MVYTAFVLLYLFVRLSSPGRPKFSSRPPGGAAASHPIVSPNPYSFGNAFHNAQSHLHHYSAENVPVRWLGLQTIVPLIGEGSPLELYLLLPYFLLPAERGPRVFLS